MNQLPAVVVEELDVPVVLRRDGDGQRGVAEDLVDLARSAWSAAQHQQQSNFVFGKKGNFDLQMSAASCLFTLLGHFNMFQLVAEIIIKSKEKTPFIQQPQFLCEAKRQIVVFSGRGSY